MIQERFRTDGLDIHYKVGRRFRRLSSVTFTTTDNVLDLFEHIFAQMFSEKKVAVAGKESSCYVCEEDLEETYQFFDRQKVGFLKSISLASEDRDHKMSVSQLVKRTCLAKSNLDFQQVFNSLSGFGMLAVVGPVESWITKVVNQLKLSIES